MRPQPRFWTHRISDRFHLFITASSATDLYYVLRKEKGREAGLRFIRRLLECADACGVDKGILIAALDSGFPDFEDAVQNAAAVADHIEIILTRNKSDYRGSPLTVFDSRGICRGPPGMIITIDGPAGAGKSSVARALARRLGFRFLDTGAMYRAVALAGMRRGLDWDVPDDLARLAPKLDLRLAGERILLDGEDVTDAVRTSEVTAVTRYAADNPQVREHLVKLQRHWPARTTLSPKAGTRGPSPFPRPSAKSSSPPARQSVPGGAGATAIPRRAGHARTGAGRPRAPRPGGRRPAGRPAAARPRCRRGLHRWPDVEEAVDRLEELARSKRK